MLRRPILLLLVLTIAGLAVGCWITGQWVRRSRVDQLQQYRRQMHAADPWERLEATSGVLRLEPGRPDVVMARATALVELGRYSQARDVADPLTRHAGGEHYMDALLLCSRTYLAEAEEWIGRETQDRSKVASDGLKKHLAEAQRLLAALGSDPVRRVQVMRLRAWLAYLRAVSVQQQIVDRSDELFLTQSAGYADRARQGAVVLADLRLQLGRWRDELVHLAGQLVELDAMDPHPRRLLFELWFHSGMLKRAVRVADEVADMQQLDIELAGRMANKLLDVERLQGQHVTARGLGTARRLLAHPRLIGTDDFEYEVAQIRLALLEGRHEQARRLAEGLLSEFPGHIGVTCLWGAALSKLGHADQAVAVLSRLNREVVSADVRRELAGAMRLMGETAASREMLRQSLEIRPRQLLAHVMLAQSMAEDGQILEAQSDIAAAEALNPNHPAVLGLRVWLFVEQVDRLGIVQLLQRQQRLGARSPRWQDAVLAGVMVLGRRDLVLRLATESLKEDAADVLALLGQRWCHTTAWHRVDLAGIVVRHVREQIDADPLACFGHPVGLDERLGSALDALTYLEPPSTSPETALLYRQAADLMAVALHRWPNQPLLLETAAGLSLWTDRLDMSRAYLDQLQDAGVTDSATAQTVGAFLGGLAQPGDAVSKGHSAAVTDESPTCLLVMLLGALQRGDDRAVQVALTQLLTRVPWAEPALLAALRDALRRDRPGQARAWLAVAGQVSPPVAQLSEARLMMAQGQPLQALRLAQSLLHGPDTASETSRMAAQIVTQALLALGQVKPAAGAFESLALSAHDQRLAMKIAAVDALLAGDQITEACAAVRDLLNQKPIAPRWLDRILIRARMALGPQRLDDILQNMLEDRPADPLLLIHQAQCAIDQRQDVRAQMLVELVLESHPRAARALMLKARLGAVLGRPEESHKLYDESIERGGVVADVARREQGSLGDSTVDLPFVAADGDQP